MDKNGLYIVFEGQDGTGKSIQAKKVVDKLNNLGVKAVHYREPGGNLECTDSIGEKIREIVTSKKTVINPLCEFALFTANRAQLIQEVKEYTNSGVNLICERCFLSSVVYQGYGRGLNIDFIIKVTEMFIDKKPDLVVIYTSNTKENINRFTQRGNIDRFENEDFDFHQRIYEGYHNLKFLCSRLGIDYIEIDTTLKDWDNYQKVVYEKILEKIKVQNLLTDNMKSG